MPFFWCGLIPRKAREAGAETQSGRSLLHFFRGLQPLSRLSIDEAGDARAAGLWCAGLPRLRNLERPRGRGPRDGPPVVFVLGKEGPRRYGGLSGTSEPGSSSGLEGPGGCLAQGALGMCTGTLLLAGLGSPGEKWFVALIRM